jgi:hypothetical protein
VDRDMFILIENNCLVNSRHIVSIYIVEEEGHFEIIFNCFPYDSLHGSEQSFEVCGKEIIYRIFKTYEEAVTALLALQIPLNVNEA